MNESNHWQVAANAVSTTPAQKSLLPAMTLLLSVLVIAQSVSTLYFNHDSQQVMESHAEALHRKEIATDQNLERSKGILSAMQKQREAMAMAQRRALYDGAKVEAVAQSAPESYVVDIEPVIDSQGCGTVVHYDDGTTSTYRPIEQPPQCLALRPKK